MAKGVVAGLYRTRQRGKKTRQGLGRNTKFRTRVASKRFKKKNIGQGK